MGRKAFDSLYPGRIQAEHFLNLPDEAAGWRCQVVGCKARLPVLRSHALEHAAIRRHVLREHTALAAEIR
eukprot:443033-Alexandrium_andersonii.AAC.1